MDITMNSTYIAEGTYQLSVNVENILFEGMWEIPNGVSLNSYIIQGDKTAIVDGFVGWDGYPDTLYALLNQIQVPLESIEFLIINHMEPDHSGWIESFRKIKPDIHILCSKQAEGLLNAFYHISENIRVIMDGDTLDLGKGHVISFIEIPYVHWPDTIGSFDTLTRTLFSCDLFGSFGALRGFNYGEDLTKDCFMEFKQDTIRYFSNIMAIYSPQVKRAITKCQTLPIRLIAPGHGLMWKNPECIIEEYLNYAEYQKGPARKEITFLWGTMYGMTLKAVEYAVQVLEKEDILVHIHQVPQESLGTILSSIWTSTGVILAMPSYEFKMFPPMAAALEELGRKRVYNRSAFRFGSYGWSGGAQKDLEEIMARYNMNWEFLEPVEFLGSPREEDLQLIEERVKRLVQVVKGVLA